MTDPLPCATINDGKVYKINYITRLSAINYKKSVKRVFFGTRYVK